MESKQKKIKFETKRVFMTTTGSLWVCESVRRYDGIATTNWCKNEKEETKLR